MDQSHPPKCPSCNFREENEKAFHHKNIPSQDAIPYGIEPSPYLSASLAIDDGDNI